MGIDISKDFRFGKNKLNALKNGQIVSETAILNFCLNPEGDAFSFSYNGELLGNELNETTSGVPKQVYQAFHLFRNGLQQLICASQEEYSEFTKTLCSEGKIYSFLFTRFSLPAGSQATALISIRDISSISNLDGENDISEILLGLVVENMTDVFCVFDLNGMLSFVSPSVEKLMGYKTEELMQKPLVEYVTIDTRSKLEDYFKNIYKLKRNCSLDADDKVPQLFEVQFVTSSKGFRWAEISIAPYTGKNNQLKGVYGIIRDISGHKQQQAEMESSLQYEIERSQVKSKYISSVSHEFRTPLSIIYSNLQLLESHMPELDAETIADSFDLSKMAVKSLLRVLDKVTIIDASGKGKLEFKPSLVYLPGHIKKLVNDLNEMEIVPGRMLVNIDPGIGEVYIDENLFHHILTNALHNALIYSDKKQFVEVNITFDDAETLKITIKDNGIGIPKEDMNLIFEPFYRATNSRFVKGSGLGLAVLTECLKLHKGSIFIDSELGKGTVIQILLPITLVGEDKLENDIP
ncbi:MAG: PAS domain-containing sensor histidine kinase [Lentimicrobium sp.]|jgi:PAS domain S-box-containing protein|nr:PAS domain-containing sensor histidine kinase [Lentimicrobium sp.]